MNAPPTALHHDHAAFSPSVQTTHDVDRFAVPQTSVIASLSAQKTSGTYMQDYNQSETICIFR